MQGPASGGGDGRTADVGQDEEGGERARRGGERDDKDPGADSLGGVSRSARGRSCARRGIEREDIDKGVGGLRFSQNGGKA